MTWSVAFDAGIPHRGAALQPTDNTNNSRGEITMAHLGRRQLYYYKVTSSPSDALV